MTPEIMGSWAVFCGIAFGILVGFPVVPFYLTAGALWGVAGLPIVLLALLIHFVASYFVARSFLRPLAEKIFKRFESKVKMPNMKAIGPIKLILLVRMIPGLPLVAASYGLALCDMPLTTYVLVSLFTQIFWAGAFILCGASLMKNNLLMLGSGCLALAVLILISKNYVRGKEAR